MSDEALRKEFANVISNFAYADNQNLVSAVDDAMELHKQQQQAAVGEANAAGHFWTHRERLDGWGHEAHFCNCGFKAGGSEAIKGHVAWKIAELTATQAERTRNENGGKV